MLIWSALSFRRTTMKGYSRCRSDFIDLLAKKYAMGEEKILGCLWDWAKATDFVLCNGNSDLLPKLYKKDEIRFEYNQRDWKRGTVSCTIFAAMGMASDQTNYEFSEEEAKEIDDTSYNNPAYTHIRYRGHWRHVSDAVDHMRKYWNGRKDLVEKYWKLASYRISKYDDDIVEDALDMLYTLDWNLCPTGEYITDFSADWMLDGTNFWYDTNWHSIDFIKQDGQRSVKDSYKGRKYNIYGLKHKLSEITNIWPNLYIYTLVSEDNYERIKKLNEMKTKILNWKEINSELWGMSGSEFHKNKLHEMNDFYRDWLSYIDSELKTLV